MLVVDLAMIRKTVAAGTGAGGSKSGLSSRGARAPFPGRIEVFVDRAAMQPRLGVRFIHPDGLQGRVFPSEGPADEALQIDEGTQKALEWNRNVSKKMHPRFFAALLLGLLAKKHPELLEAVGVRVTDTGGVSLVTCLRLSVFARIKGDQMSSLRVFILSRSKAAGPVEIGGRPAVLFIHVAPENVTFEQEALPHVQRWLEQETGASQELFQGELRVSDLLQLGDEIVIPRFRGFLLHAALVLFELLKDGPRLDKKVRELLVVARALAPYIDRIRTYLRFFEVKDHHDVLEELRKIGMAPSAPGPGRAEEPAPGRAEGRRRPPARTRPADRRRPGAKKPKRPRSAKG